MPETVCVTLEQLREILDNLGGEEIVFEASPRIAVIPEYLEAAQTLIGNAIAQAERLEDWRPNVGDRVRLRAMPDARGVVFASGKPQVQVLWDESSLHLGQWRYIAELMPEEGE